MELSIHFNLHRSRFIIVTTSALFFFATLSFFHFPGNAIGIEAEPLVPEYPMRLPQSIDNQSIAPDLGCFWSIKLQDDQSFESYKQFIDVVGPTNAFDSLSITLRNLSFFANNQEAIQITKKAVEYAFKKYGIRSLLDLDLRIARHDFEKTYPHLAIERLLFLDRKVDSSKLATIDFRFETSVLSDHYSGSIPYFVRGARVVKAWGYNYNKDGVIVPESIIDVTNMAQWDNNQFVVTNKPGYIIETTVNSSLDVSFEKTALPSSVSAVSVAVAFRYSYPDLFADETLEFEKDIYESYRDVPAIGGYKDEWGFPPNFNRLESLNDYWYSDKMAQAYATRFDGRQLIDDLFLASQPQSNRDRERIESVDRYRRLCADRVLEFENQNYNLNKELWGPNAFVGLHTSWYPWPNILEMRKNGIMWWKASRDFAQTDEYVPFCIRNSIAKGCGSLWINMFYDRQTPPYVTEHWTAAASGGRVHIHQLYPRDEQSPSNPFDSKLLPIAEDAGIYKIREKIRMLSLISNSQIYSPIAVVFGRLGASNPLRPEYMAIGIDLCDQFAEQGFPADLIPVDEVFTYRPDGTKRWDVKDSYLSYGDQKYEVIILYGENDAEQEAWDALHALVTSEPSCKTQLVRIQGGATSNEKEKIVNQVLQRVIQEGVEPQTPWVRDFAFFSEKTEISTRPPRTSMSRFIDGSVLWIAATQSDFGDPIIMEHQTVRLSNGITSEPISVNSIGLFSVRFDPDGKANAFVATEVKSLEIGDFSFKLTDNEIGDSPIDLAIWRTKKGSWCGVFQREHNTLPESIGKLIPTWNFLQKR